MRILLLILLIFSTKVFSQKINQESSSIKGSNTIYVELLGPALLGSLNYERGFYLKKNNKISGRVGFSYFEAPVFPIGMSIEFGKNKSFFQLNVNRVFYETQANDDISNTSLGIAYVRRPIRGFYFHSSLYYVVLDEEQISSEATIKSIPWIGFGFGYSF